VRIEEARAVQIHHRGDVRLPPGRRTAHRRHSCRTRRPATRAINRSTWAQW
jgi:hypothetical protein